MRGIRRPVHGGPMGPALPRGGGVCGGARLKGVNLKKNIQKTKCSALLATRRLDWLVSARAQMRCNACWARVGLSAGFVTGVFFARLNDVKRAISFAQQGQDLSNHMNNLSGATSRGRSSRDGNFTEALLAHAPSMRTAGSAVP
eukprot:4539052-Pyramimonas_sp.AAC.1